MNTANLLWELKLRERLDNRVTMTSVQSEAGELKHALEPRMGIAPTEGRKGRMANNYD